MNRCVLIISLFALFLAQDASAAELRRVEEKHFDMPRGGSIILIGDEGSIDITSWNKEEVFLKITRTIWERDDRQAEELMEELYVKIDHSGDELYIKEVDLRNESGFHFDDLFSGRDRMSYRIDFELIVPNNVNLRIENDEGDVAISGVSGKMNIQVDEGSLRLQDITSTEVRLSADEGNVECTHVDGSGGRFGVDVDEGDFHLDDCTAGDLRIDADEGDIVLRKVRAEYCKISTDEGDIELQLDLSPDGRCTLRTDEGDLLILLPDEPNLSLDLYSKDGHIESDFPLKIRKGDDEGQRLDGVLGSPLSSLSASTDDGNIYLRKR